MHMTKPETNVPRWAVPLLSTQVTISVWFKWIILSVPENKTGSYAEHRNNVKMWSMSDGINNLRYDGDLWPQIVQTIVSNVVAINKDGCTCCLNDTEYGRSERIWQHQYDQRYQPERKQYVIALYSDIYMNIFIIIWQSQYIPHTAARVLHSSALHWIVFITTLDVECFTQPSASWNIHTSGSNKSHYSIMECVVIVYYS